MHKFPKLRTALTFLGLAVLLGITDCSATEAKSTDAPGLRSIAFEHYLSGDTEAALDYYQKAIDTASREYGPDSSYIGQLYYEMGTLALDAKKFVRSESYLQKAVQHNPNSVMARVKFAELLQMRGKNEEALQQINAALAKHSNSPEAREALVIWLQANHKTARAIHESYNVTRAASGSNVAPPVTQAVLARAENAKSEEPAMIAAAPPIPAPTPVPATAQATTKPPVKTPLKLFPWMQAEKKPEPKKEEVKEKPAEKKDDKKALESKKSDKNDKKNASSKKESRQQKTAKEKHAKPTRPAQEHMTDESLSASTAALRTTAKTIPKKKEASESAPTAAPPAPPVVLAVPPVKSSKRSNTMVPPPPPLVPSFANPMGMFQPVPQMYQPPAAPKAAAKKPKPAAATQAKEAPAESKAAAASSGGGEESDPSFLLDWGGANAKKKGK